MGTRRVELLLPAGNMEKLETAFLYGADAVYLGGPLLGLRAKAGNFSLEEIAQAVDRAHELGKKVYVTTNIYAQNRDLEEAAEFLQALESIHPDGIILSDMGILRLARIHAPSLSVRISTQANVTNLEACRLYRELGAQCVVLARELNLEEIGEIAHNAGLDIEVFVHGAMCMAYSGRCMLSMFMTGRSANRGECTHPCRWPYHVVETQRPDAPYPVLEDEEGTYLFNAKDLCTIHEIDRLVQTGASSFKVEGRMKSVHYVATVCKTYREALDAYQQNPGEYKVRDEWLRELDIISDRAYCTGFLFGRPDGGDHNYEVCNTDREVRFCARVLGFDATDSELVLEQRNRFFVGETLEFLLPAGANVQGKVATMKDETGNPIEVCPHPRQVIRIPWPQALPAGTLVRVIREA